MNTNQPLKKPVTAAILNPEAVEQDMHELFAAQMCIYTSGQIAKECCAAVLHIMQKYSLKDTTLKQLIKSIANFTANSTHQLAMLSGKGANKNRMLHTALSANNFVQIFMAAVSIVPEQVDMFCNDVEQIGLKYLKDTAMPQQKSFSLEAWLRSDDWKQGTDFWSKLNSDFTITFCNVKGVDSIKIKEGKTIRYSGPLPSSDYDANCLFNSLLRC